MSMRTASAGYYRFHFPKTSFETGINAQYFLKDIRDIPLGSSSPSCQILTLRSGTKIVPRGCPKRRPRNLETNPSWTSCSLTGMVARHAHYFSNLSVSDRLVPFQTAAKILQSMPGEASAQAHAS
eukprot:GHVT01058215.1.p1 GENE.GHVT01058215.1~~GHVT01058215.1.p1  ORF type:complete len:125 (-),score=9.27 GHVT01058215.1:44-418(-)